MEFYNFLQVNTDSNKSEVIDHARKDNEEDNEEEEVDQRAAQSNQNKAAAAAASLPFIDFLSVGGSS